MAGLFYELPKQIDSPEFRATWTEAEEAWEQNNRRAMAQATRRQKWRELAEAGLSPRVAARVVRTFLVGRAWKSVIITADDRSDSARELGRPLPGKPEDY